MYNKLGRPSARQTGPHDALTRGAGQRVWRKGLGRGGLGPGPRGIEAAMAWRGVAQSLDDSARGVSPIRRSRPERATAHCSPRQDLIKLSAERRWYVVEK